MIAWFYNLSYLSRYTQFHFEVYNQQVMDYFQPPDFFRINY